MLKLVQYWLHKYGVPYVAKTSYSNIFIIYLHWIYKLSTIFICMLLHIFKCGPDIHILIRFINMSHICTIAIGFVECSQRCIYAPDLMIWLDISVSLADLHVRPDLYNMVYIHYTRLNIILPSDLYTRAWFMCAVQYLLGALDL